MDLDSEIVQNLISFETNVAKNIPIEWNDMQHFVLFRFTCRIWQNQTKKKKQKIPLIILTGTIFFPIDTVCVVFIFWNADVFQMIIGYTHEFIWLSKKKHWNSLIGLVHSLAIDISRNIHVRNSKLSFNRMYINYTMA